MTRPPVVAIRGLRFNLPAACPGDPEVLRAELAAAAPDPSPGYVFLSRALGPEYARLLNARDRGEVSEADMQELVVLIFARYGHVYQEVVVL